MIWIPVLTLIIGLLVGAACMALYFLNRAVSSVENKVNALLLKVDLLQSANELLNEMERSKSQPIRKHEPEPLRWNTEWPTHKE
jgi:hypothetical protein